MKAVFMAKKVRRTRRGNGEGSIYQRQDGVWCAVVSIGNDEKGKLKKKYIYAGTRTEVIKKMSDFTGKMQRNMASAANKYTIGELMLEWLLVFKKHAVTPRTFENNIRNFRLHIEPYIGNMKIDEVTPSVIQNIFNQLFLKGLAVPTVKKIKWVLNQFFDYAVDTELIDKSPTIKTKLRNSDRKAVNSENMYKAIPQDVRMQFINKLNNHELLKPLCMTSMFAGLRIGELLALKWHGVDLKNKTIKVTNAITQKPKFNDKGEIISRTTIIAATKTACSVREVPIPDILVDVLEDWKKVQWLKEQVYGVELTKPENIVFSKNDGSVRSYSGTRMILNRFLKRNNLTKHGIHFHSLRHTYSNMLFETGENPKIIQMLLGHRDVKTTISIYNSVDQSYFKQATDKLNKLFNTESMEMYNKLKEKPKALVYEMKPIDEMSEEDKEIEALERILAEKRARKKNDFEM
jgi:integrase